MFTIDDINQAHSKVKSGADFPAYIQEIKKLGVTSYDTYVADGHADYHGPNSFTVPGLPKHEEISIAQECSKELFIAELKAHQQGKTDYTGFLNDCAKDGIEKWEVDIEKLTCTYFDKAGNEILVEKIPEALPEN